MSSRCILVLGVGRSGTSAVAGILHHLGVSMGEPYNAASRANPHGTFEDEEMFNAAREILLQDGSPEIYEPLVEERSKQPLWGLKDPALCQTGHYIFRLLDDVRIIRVMRPAHECIDSYMRAYYAGRKTAMAWYNQLVVELAARILEFEGPILDVEWHDVLEDPTEQVRRISDFVFEGRDPPDMAHFNAAVNHIRPETIRRPAGWGSIAVGIRVHRHPDPYFYCDSLAFVNGGLRRGDTLLQPVVGMAAHHAAQKLAKAFLRSGKDSLLLMDDDHGFRKDSLHRMRENRDTWPFDAVMALIVRRVPDKPSPILMWLKDQEPEPESLYGDSFELPPDVRIGEVKPVDALGFGFTLIKRHVLEAMINPDWGLDYSFEELFKYGPGRESDDIPFCRRLREMKFRMAIDTSVQVLHWAIHGLSYDDWLKIREEEIERLQGEQRGPTADLIRRSD